jgi:hypothetical protein
MRDKGGRTMRKLVVLAGTAAIITVACACSSSSSSTPAKVTGTEVFQGRQPLDAAALANQNFTPTYPLTFTGPVVATATWSPPGGNATKVTTTFKTTAGNLVVNADVPNANNPPTTTNATTCLSTSTITGTYTVVGGQSTGKFKGATGNGKIVDVFQATLPKLSNGKCNESQNAQPLPNGAVTTFYASGPLTIQPS